MKILKIQESNYKISLITIFKIIIKIKIIKFKSNHPTIHKILIKICLKLSGISRKFYNQEILPKVNKFFSF